MKPIQRPELDAYSLNGNPNMKKILATAIATVAFASLAYAGEVEGTVSDVDMDNGVITLEDGQNFSAGDEVDLESIKAGDHVKLTVEDDSDTAIAVTVE